MTSDSERISVTATSDDQVAAFENAADAVEADVEAGVVEADRWHGEVKNGEVLRILAEAYTGDLDLDVEAMGER